MELRSACRALYDQAFPGEDVSFTDRLFDLYFPFIRITEREGTVQSLLFSIPCPIRTAGGLRDARYLYGVCTSVQARGQGLATALLRREAAKGRPVFLRPATEELFAFYRKVGFSPVSPLLCEEGSAGATRKDICRLSVSQYSQKRADFLPRPHACPAVEFLALAASDGGMIGGDDFAALYEYAGDGGRVLFREYAGDPRSAAAAAAFLGASSYCCRRPDPRGRAFGMGFGTPAGFYFLTALD